MALKVAPKVWGLAPVAPNGTLVEPMAHGGTNGTNIMVAPNSRK